MTRPIGRHVALAVALGVGIPLALFVGQAWRTKASLHGQGSAEPFRIAGDFYSVGTSDLSSFLITGPEGHLLFAAGYPTTVPLIVSSIETLGFRLADVKALVVSSGALDQGGVLAGLQAASGAEVWANDITAGVLAGGGADADTFMPMRTLVQVGLAGYTPPRVDRRFTDGDTIRVGPIAITAHLTPGGTRDCTSWTFSVRDGDRVLNVVKVCGFERVLGWRYDGQEADIERSLRALRGLPADIWVTTHGRAWGRYRKFVASGTAKNPADAFVDPDGYRAFLDAAEAELVSGKTH